MKNTSVYILNELVIDNFFDQVSSSYELLEHGEGGKSRLIWHCKSKESRCISNFDEKYTGLHFLKPDKEKMLYKRVDHVVFEQNQHQKWDVHLIEMKAGVESSDKWYEIKGKFRASYFAVRAISAVLDFEIENYYFYTTYGHASFMAKKENTVPRRAALGRKVIPLEDEWTGKSFGLNIGDRLSFKHTPIEMVEVGDFLEGNGGECSDMEGENTVPSNT